jgi:hypothetical protein
LARSPDNHKLAFVCFRPALSPTKAELGTYDFDTGATNSILHDLVLRAAVAWMRVNRLIYSLTESFTNSTMEASVRT